jgi:hypothetical protein
MKDEKHVVSSVERPIGRKFERAELDLYVNKIVGDEPHLVRVRDISGGGVYLWKLLEPELEGQHVGIEMKLPNSDEIIWAVGQVVREHTEEGVLGQGVRFVRIAESDRRLIEDFVATSRADVAVA